jgi:hypothetical protein
MLAMINLAIVSIWLFVELVPVLADRMADLECHHRNDKWR